MAILQFILDGHWFCLPRGHHARWNKLICRKKNTDDTVRHGIKRILTEAKNGMLIAKGGGLGKWDDLGQSV